MYVTQHRITFALFGLLLIWGGCYVEDPSPNPMLSLPYDNINELLDTLKSPSQTFTIDIGQDASINGDKGSVINFPANSLLDAAGNSVSGMVNIRLLEVFDKRQMVLNNIMSTSGGELLESGGVLFLEASKDGAAPHLGGEIKGQLPISSGLSNSDNMAIFYGNSTGSNWNLAGDTSEVIVDPSMNVFNSFFSELDWVSLADPYQPGQNRTKIEAIASGGLTTEAVGFIVFSDINAVMAFPYNGSRFVANNVPVGEKAHIVILAMDPNNLFLGIKEITTTENLEVEVIINFTTETIITQRINTLP